MDSYLYNSSCRFFTYNIYGNFIRTGINNYTCFCRKGKQILPALLFVDVLTGVVLFFGLMFFRIYTFFWYPALINNEKRAFLKAKRFADKNFWKILNAIFIFDIIFVGFQMTFIKFDDNILFLILKWIFLTVFYALLTTYIFAAYKKYSEADRLKKA